MITVVLNRVEEYLDELRKSPPPDKILRLTMIQHRYQDIPPESLSLVATYLNSQDQIVKLDSYCGELWGLRKDTDQKVYDRATLSSDKIKKTAAGLGLDIRDGKLQGDSK